MLLCLVRLDGTGTVPPRHALTPCHLSISLISSSCLLCRDRRGCDEFDGPPLSHTYIHTTYTYISSPFPYLHPLCLILIPNLRDAYVVDHPPKMGLYHTA
ncbi:hypothetical protein Hanom_Chr14g01268011 [Helianthus anomalus]